MSRREGSGLSHTPQNAPEGNGRDSRPPSLPASRYVDLPMHPSTQHGRSDPPQYSPYGHPPPHTRLSYPPDPPLPDSRHSVPPPRQMEMTRPHERAVVYARPPEYYTTDTLVAPVHQPAPRQRTAVACRYCRRRKIRCSGYQSSPDGRCTNCVQRDQKCEFLPVSAAPYEAPRPDLPYMTPPQSTSQIAMGQRPSPQYSIQPPPPPSYHLSPYASPPQPRVAVSRSSEMEPLSPPRKKQMLDPMSSSKPNLAPLQTGSTLRRRPTSHELRSGYPEGRLGAPYSDYGQHSPPYSAAPSPHHRRSSLYSTSTTVPPPPPSALLSARSAPENTPYSVVGPPPPFSPPRVTPVHARRYSYQLQSPYSPQQVHSQRPMSQGRPHIPSPMPVARPLPPPAFSRSPNIHYRHDPRSASIEYLDRPTKSPPYEYTESPSLPPLTHLNRETPPTPSVPQPMPSPIPVSLPPPSGMITAPRNPQDSAILSAFDTVSVTPSSVAKRKRTPSPEPAARKP